MNRLVIISVIISGLFLGSCKTQQKATTSSPDDVYYQPSMAQDYAKPAPNSPQVVTSPDTTRAGNPASSTLAEDLNDYSYAARVKRFNNPTPGSGYYDDTYTNPANYDTTYQESSSPNVNVYVGAGFGAYGGSSMMFGFGTGMDMIPGAGVTPGATLIMATATRPTTGTTPGTIRILTGTATDMATGMAITTDTMMAITAILTAEEGTMDGTILTQRITVGGPTRPAVGKV